MIKSCTEETLSCELLLRRRSRYQPAIQPHLELESNFESRSCSVYQAACAYCGPNGHALAVSELERAYVPLLYLQKQTAL